MLDDHRLVTVTGLPGVGKTAVSLEAAAANFADGAVLVRLDTLRDEALLPHSILAALRLPDRFISRPLEVLVDQLHDRHMLIVFDTCEHLLGACAALTAALLQPCAKVQILATSREPLRVPGESTLAVRPLRLRDAMTLFSQRAAGSGLAARPQDRADVASICLQLDKLPLAIELATGSRPPAPSVSRLLSAVEADYDVLRDPANPVTRHQSLRAAIGWSHELCTPAERLLWARLSVFTGPFGLRDAYDVCTTSQLPDQAVTAGLSLLTERSILLADVRTDGEVSYLLPVTLRGYGQQMLRRLAADAEFQNRYQRWQQHRQRRGRGTPAIL
jgi:non-specific serine/threonine protein kinase